MEPVSAGGAHRSALEVMKEERATRAGALVSSKQECTKRLEALVSSQGEGKKAAEKDVEAEKAVNAEQEKVDTQQHEIDKRQHEIDTRQLEQDKSKQQLMTCQAAMVSASGASKKIAEKIVFSQDAFAVQEGLVATQEGELQEIDEVIDRVTKATDQKDAATKGLEEAAEAASVAFGEAGSSSAFGEAAAAAEAALQKAEDETAAATKEFQDAGRAFRALTLALQSNVRPHSGGCLPRGAAEEEGGARVGGGGQSGGSLDDSSEGVSSGNELPPPINQGDDASPAAPMIGLSKVEVYAMAGGELREACLTGQTTGRTGKQKAKTDGQLHYHLSKVRPNPREGTGGAAAEGGGA
ncbi:hypothetical protein T484DRAFT_1920085, partial [Baffinella frigidus]